MPNGVVPASARQRLLALSLKERLEVRGLQRLCEQEALPLVTTLALEGPELCRVLNALGERLQAKRLAESQQRVRQRG